jgi:hypothetical protein
MPVPLSQRVVMPDSLPKYTDRAADMTGLIARRARQAAATGRTWSRAVEVIPRLARCSVFKDRSVPAVGGTLRAGTNRLKGDHPVYRRIRARPVCEHSRCLGGPGSVAAASRQAAGSSIPAAPVQGNEGGRPGGADHQSRASTQSAPGLRKRPRRLTSSRRPRARTAACPPGAPCPPDLPSGRRGGRRPPPRRRPSRRPGRAAGAPRWC